MSQAAVLWWRLIWISLREFLSVINQTFSVGQEEPRTFFMAKKLSLCIKYILLRPPEKAKCAGGGGGVGRRAVGGWLASRWFLDGETALASQSYTQTICRHKISVLRDIDSLENKNSTRTHEHKLSKLHCYRIVRVSFHSVCHTSMFRRHPLTGESGYKRRSTNKVSGNPRAIDR